jgi:hypothetical protein
MRRFMEDGMVSMLQRAGGLLSLRWAEEGKDYLPWHQIFTYCVSRYSVLLRTYHVFNMVALKLTMLTIVIYLRSTP